MRRFLLPALTILALTLAACSATPSPLPSTVQFDSSTRIDNQGAIIFEVTPLDLASSADTLSFDIVLTTHSIDLSVDLAATATLTTDTGLTVRAALWDAPRGGHHVAGKLIFPAIVDGKPILDSPTKLTLTILDVDAPSRVFERGVQ